MRLPDGGTLMHEGRPYDPAKAHEYYMRTRNLKGRAKGAGVTGVADAMRRRGPQPAKPSPKTSAQKLSEIKKKMDQLKSLVNQGKNDSNTRTAAEKAHAAKEQQKTVTKLRQNLADLNQQLKDKIAGKAPQSEIDAVKAKLSDAQKELAAATRNG